jgi:hypothetical protein
MTDGMTNDDGLEFRAEMQFADLTFQTRVTTNRRELLAWIATHCEAGGELLELGMTARGQALQNMLVAVTFGGRADP